MNCVHLICNGSQDINFYIISKGAQKFSTENQMNFNAWLEYIFKIDIIFYLIS